MARSPSAPGTSGVIESARWMLGGLGVQFVVGMYTNLFVAMPPRSVGGMMVHMGFGGRMPPIFGVHMWLGVALAVGATVVLGVGWHTARRATVVAWAAILLAGYGGLINVFYGRPAQFGFFHHGTRVAHGGRGLRRYRRFHRFQDVARATTRIYYGFGLLAARTAYPDL